MVTLHVHVVVAIAIDIANVHIGLWSSSHSSVACFPVCKITNQLLLATSSASLQAWAGLVSRAWVGIVMKIIIIIKVHKQDSKKILNQINRM